MPAAIRARIYSGEFEPAVKELNEAAWEFRREQAHRVELRTVPAQHFKYDDSVDRGERIDNLLRDLPDARPTQAEADEE